MRPYRLLFSTTDRDGNEVRLSSQQWYGHIVNKHSDVEPYLEEIKSIIQDPEIIADGRSGEFYLLSLGVVDSHLRQYLKIVVAYSSEVTGRRIGSVRTAYFTGRRPKGGITYEREPN